MQLYGDGSPIYVASLNSGAVLFTFWGRSPWHLAYNLLIWSRNASGVFGLGFNIEKLYLNGCEYFRYGFYMINTLPTADREMCNDITQTCGAVYMSLVHGRILTCHVGGRVRFLNDGAYISMLALSKYRLHPSVFDIVNNSPRRCISKNIESEFGR